MANTENVDGAKPSSPVPEPPNPEPRVTNDSEGGKKQKEAVKRLSDYSKAAIAKKAREAKVASPKEEVVEEPLEEEVVGKSSWNISMGNVIAAAGVAVAMICLYLSYPERKKCDISLDLENHRNGGERGPHQNFQLRRPREDCEKGCRA